MTNYVLFIQELSIFTFEEKINDAVEAGFMPFGEIQRMEQDYFMAMSYKNASIAPSSIKTLIEPPYITQCLEHLIFFTKIKSILTYSDKNIYIVTDSKRIIALESELILERAKEICRRNKDVIKITPDHTTSYPKQVVIEYKEQKIGSAMQYETNIEIALNALKLLYKLEQEGKIEKYIPF